MHLWTNKNNEKNTDWGIKQIIPAKTNKRQQFLKNKVYVTLGSFENLFEKKKMVNTDEIA